MATATQTHYRTCNLCEAMCGIKIEYQGNQVLSIKGDEDDPFSKGHICPKATALQDIYEDPDRLKYPVRRTDDGWEQISWDEVFDEVVTNLQAIQEKQGRNAVGIFLGNPVVHNLGSMLFSPPFVRALRTRNRFSATSTDQLPHHFAAFFMFGHQVLIPIPDVDRTDFFLILGANPIASNGSLMTAGGIGNRLKALQQRGGKFVVIDPRYTETAQRADTHHFIQPGTDALLLLAMVCTLFADDLVDMGRLQSMVKQLDELRDAVSEFTPETVADVIGTPANTIRSLTREFAHAESAVAYGRMGVSTQAYGGICHWLINCLNILTGNFDRAGGAMFTLPAFDIVGITTLTGQVGNYDRWRSRVRDLPAFGGELPSSTMAEEILTDGDGQIKAMVTVAGNPVLSTPNGGQLDKALASLDYMVSIDIYINETTRHANIILPPTTGLETEHYDLVFHALAVRNTAKYSAPLFEADDNQRHDWQIFRELRQRLEANSRNVLRGRDVFRYLSPRRLVDLVLRIGPYGRWLRPPVVGDGINIHTLERNPHGIDLGALVPMLPDRLATDDKLIHLAPNILVNDLARVRDDLMQTDDPLANGYHLRLIGRRHLRSNNSWMHNSERLVRGKNRCTVMIHPDDAQTFSVCSGEMVTVKSRVGTVKIEAEVTDKIMRGVVSIPHGWGHHREGVQLDVATQYAGVSLNDLTDDLQIDKLTGNAAFSGVPVTIIN